MTAQSRSKALVPLLIAAGVLAVAVVVVLVMFLGRPTEPAAAPSPSSTPVDQQPSPTPSPTPTPSSTPSASADATPREVAVGPDGFDIVAEDGTSLFTYLWTDDADDAVAELTDVFGAEPSESLVEGDQTHFPDYTSYNWDGFALRDMIPSEGGKSRDEYFTPSYASITANEVNGIAVVGEFGLAVGLSVDDVRALDPDEEIEMSDGTPRFFFATDRDDDAVEDEVYGYSPWVETDGSAVVQITYRPYSEL